MRRLTLAQRTGNNNIYAHYVAVFMGTATFSPTKLYRVRININHHQRIVFIGQDHRRLSDWRDDAIH